jgi:predicted AAA+ superfamily ATPase
VRKEQKHYHFDWTAVPDPAARFENLVACHILKWIHYRQDTERRDLDLRYFRDVDRREVDFVVVEGRRPTLMIECKWAETEVDRGLRYLRARFPDCEAWQISATGAKDYVTPEGIRVAPAWRLLGDWV